MSAVKWELYVKAIKIQMFFWFCACHFIPNSFITLEQLSKILFAIIRKEIGKALGTHHHRAAPLPAKPFWHGRQGLQWPQNDPVRWDEDRLCSSSGPHSSEICAFHALLLLDLLPPGTASPPEYTWWSPGSTTPTVSFGLCIQRLDLLFVFIAKILGIENVL